MAVIQYESDVSVRGRVLINGGLPYQFLKADGSLDSNTYALASSIHAPVTLGTANGLSLSNQQLSLGLASSSTTGALSGTDWNTFNGKFNTPTGLTTNYLPKWNGNGFGNSQIFDNGTNVAIGSASIQLFGFGNFGGGVISDLKLAVGNATYSNGFAEITNGSKLVFGYKNQLVSPNEMASIQMVAESIANNNEASSLRFFTKSGVVSTIANEKMRITPSGRALFNTTTDNGVDQVQVAGTISASPATTANQVPTWGQVQAMASSGTYTPSNQTNAAQTVNFIRSYWEKNGNVLTVTTSLTYTVTQIQSTSSFLITLPNGFLVSGASSGRIIGSSLLHTTQGIFNNNANMKAYEASDSSKINLQANFQAPVSSGTYETTIIYTVLIQ